MKCPKCGSELEILKGRRVGLATEPLSLKCSDCGCECIAVNGRVFRAGPCDECGAEWIGPYRVHGENCAEGQAEVEGSSHAMAPSGREGTMTLTKMANTYAMLLEVATNMARGNELDLAGLRGFHNEILDHADDSYAERLKRP